MLWPVNLTFPEYSSWNSLQQLFSRSFWKFLITVAMDILWSLYTCWPPQNFMVRTLTPLIRLCKLQLYTLLILLLLPPSCCLSSTLAAELYHAFVNCPLGHAAFVPSSVYALLLEAVKWGPILKVLRSSHSSVLIHMNLSK